MFLTLLFHFRSNFVVLLSFFLDTAFSFPSQGFKGPLNFLCLYKEGSLLQLNCHLFHLSSDRLFICLFCLFVSSVYLYQLFHSLHRFIFSHEKLSSVELSFWFTLPSFIILHLFICSSVLYI